MSKKNLFLIIVFLLLFVVVVGGYLFDVFKTTQDLNVIESKELITKVDLIFLTSPKYSDKKEFSITDDKTLDSLNNSFHNNMIPSSEQIAKANKVHVIMTIYKQNKKAEIQIYNSEYTGWIVRVKEKVFKNEIVFDLVKRYL